MTNNETAVTVAFVALEHVKQSSVGENRREVRREARIVKLGLRSVETSGFLIEPVDELALGDFKIIGITPAVSAQADVDPPRFEQPDGLEFSFEPVQSLGIVRDRENTLKLAVLADQPTALPQDVELVGVVPAPVGMYAVSAYSTETDEVQLGFAVAGTPPVDWVGIAERKRNAARAEERREREQRERERRQAEARAERESRAVQKREAERVLVETFETTDPEVAARLRESYGRMLVRTRRLGAKFMIEDSEGRGAEILATVQQEREELIAQGEDPDKIFERRRDEAALALAAR